MNSDKRQSAVSDFSCGISKIRLFDLVAQKGDQLVQGPVPGLPSLSYRQVYLLARVEFRYSLAVADPCYLRIRKASCLDFFKSQIQASSSSWLTSEMPSLFQALCSFPSLSQICNSLGHLDQKFCQNFQDQVKLEVTENSK